MHGGVTGKAREGLPMSIVVSTLVVVGYCLTGILSCRCPDPSREVRPRGVIFAPIGYT